MNSYKSHDISTLVGKTISRISQDGDVFETKDGFRFRFYHDQDCCESVGIHDIKGETFNLLDVPVLAAVETNEDPKDVKLDRSLESWTWTIYTITTTKGTVSFRWLGESNGYYNESVSISITRI